MASRRFLILAASAALALVAGCSTAHSPTVVDLAPAAPTGLRATVEAGAVTVAWDPNVSDADFAGFRLSRATRGEQAILVESPADITRYVDAAAPRGVLTTYRVSAVDAAGNESAWASINITLGLRHDGPTPDDGTATEPVRPGTAPIPRTHGGDRTQH